MLGRSLHPLLTTVPAIACAAAVVLAGAWALGPNLPGADAEPLFDTHNDRGGVTEIVSPLVDIRSRLVNQAENELFTVGADLPSYWRAAALPEFDGEQWSLPETILDEVNETANAPASGSVPNEQLITIRGLEGALVPAAAEPVRAEGPGLGFNSLTQTLVKTTSELDDGDIYAVISAMPRFTSEQLQGATADSPPDPVFLELPDDLPAVVGTTASEVTAGQPTVFDQMVTLQDWFRTEFTYSTDVPDGHGNSAIESFLEDRVGYCEQFAGTFAAMARSLGIPSRVAVGFTQGQVQDDGTYLVLGRNAHAWPEVWFDGYGWVPFEPTPGRGMPGAEAYTGIPPQQDGDPAPTHHDNDDDHDDDYAAGPDDDRCRSGRRPSSGGDHHHDRASDPATCPPAPGNGRRRLVPVAPRARPDRRGRPPGRPARDRPTLAPATPRPDHGSRPCSPRTVGPGDAGAVGGRVPRRSGADPDRGVRACGDRLPCRRRSAAFARRRRHGSVVRTARQSSTLAAADRHGHGHDGPHGWCALVEGTVEDSLSLPARFKRYFTIWH